MKSKGTAREQWVEQHAADSSSRDRGDFDGEPQTTSLRDYIQEAAGENGPELVRERIRIAEKAFRGMEKSPDAFSPTTDKFSGWFDVLQDLGSLYGVLAPWERGKEAQTYKTAFDYFELALDVPIELHGGERWSLVHNNKGAIHHWHAMWLAGGAKRKLLDDFPFGQRAACRVELSSAVHHCKRALEVRDSWDDGKLDDASAFQLTSLAQTLQNLGTALPHQAWLSKSAQLAIEARQYLDRVQNLMRFGSVQTAFPHLDGDIAEAELVLEKLTELGISGDTGTSSNNTGVATVPHDTDAQDPSTSPLASDFANASLGELVGAFIPEITAKGISRLEEVVRQAQAVPPPDRRTFVDDVSRLLEAHLLRFEVQTESGPQLAKLTMKGRSIQFSAATNIGFRRDFRIVRVPKAFGRSGPKPKIEQP